MKLNIAYPAQGSQKLLEIDDDRKLKVFYDRRIAQEVPGDSLGDEWKGYILRITGGNDKQGFPMMQGVLLATRARLLLRKGHPCYRPRRTGERKRKSVRGCIVDPNLSVLNLIVVKRGEAEIPGLTDRTVPKRLGPKRASKIRKLFLLSKDDDVRHYVVRRQLPRAKEGKKPKSKAPKIQRLITPDRLRRKRHRQLIKQRRFAASRAAADEYKRLLAQKQKEDKEKKLKLKKRRLSSLRASRSKSATSDS